MSEERLQEAANMVDSSSDAYLERQSATNRRVRLNQTRSREARRGAPITFAV